MPGIVWQGSIRGFKYRIVVLTRNSYVIERLRYDAMREPRWELFSNDSVIIAIALWSLYQDAINKKGLTQ